MPPTITIIGPTTVESTRDGSTLVHPCRVLDLLRLPPRIERDLIVLVFDVDALLQVPRPAEIRAIPAAEKSPPLDELRRVLGARRRTPDAPTVYETRIVPLAIRRIMGSVWHSVLAGGWAVVVLPTPIQLKGGDSIGHLFEMGLPPIRTEREATGAQLLDTPVPGDVVPALRRFAALHRGIFQKAAGHISLRVDGRGTAQGQFPLQTFLPTSAASVRVEAQPVVGTADASRAHSLLLRVGRGGMVLIPNAGDLDVDALIGMAIGCALKPDGAVPAAVNVNPRLLSFTGERVAITGGRYGWKVRLGGQEVRLGARAFHRLAYLVAARILGKQGVNLGEGTVEGGNEIVFPEAKPNSAKATARAVQAINDEFRRVLADRLLTVVEYVGRAAAQPMYRVRDTIHLAPDWVAAIQATDAAEFRDLKNFLAQRR